MNEYDRQKHTLRTVLDADVPDYKADQLVQNAADTWSTLSQIQLLVSAQPS